PRIDWSMQLSPSSVRLSGRFFDGIEAAQTFGFVSGSAAGYVRKVKVRNAGASRVKLRVVCLSDPTAAHFGISIDRWGSLGINAFNREGRVAMDEISEPHAARVIGAIPSPARIYMTSDRNRATELLQGGDLPEETAGMSGQVLVLSVHELELAPSESEELAFASLYGPDKLEDVLSAFGKLSPAETSPPSGEPWFACSSPGISEAFSWAAATIGGARYGDDLLDRLEATRGAEYIDPRAAEGIVADARSLVDRGGFLGHSQDPTKPGFLETSLFISTASRHFALVGDRKAARKSYLLLKKMAGALSARSREGGVRLEPGLPQGWRRALRTGHPAGEVPEVSLATASAFRDLSLVSALLDKGEEAASFAERSELIAEGVARRLRDQRGFLCSGTDSTGRPLQGETVDMAVACYRNTGLRSVASSAVHRLLEDDFETEYGPRTVPTSNRTYFHCSYGQGQLGGYWTRAALSLACLSYAVALPGVGSLLLEKVSRLVMEDALKFGGIPGEFPFWVDIEGREAHGDGSDPVAASRFVEALVEGELGFKVSQGVPCFDPPKLSAIKWALAKDIWAGEAASIFVGRAAGKTVSFASCRRAEVKSGQRFESCEAVDVSARGVHAVSFYGPGQVVCVGNSSSSPVRAHVDFLGKAPGLTSRLSTPLEEFDPAGETWSKIGSLRVSPRMSFDAPLGPGEWKAFRISND
ncbi:MAG TPA: hypothetical protein VKF15_06225, partial [Nitrososphaerales archaeon]|nr:hypothetical protein [Nitrososphaerales archaeon]